MKLRDFNKLFLTTAVGMTFIPGISQSKTVNTTRIRFGGPVFDTFDSPEELIRILQQLGYTAAYCPVEIGEKSVTVNAYKTAAKKANIIVSEVGVWSNPIDPDEKKAQEAINKCIASLELAEEIAANCCVNVSGSRNPEKWAGPHEQNLTPDTFDLIVETTRKIIDAVKPKQTFYSLEIMPWVIPIQLIRL